MIILIAGASHTGKTKLAQELLEQYKYPYLSIDHLKMGLIRSGHTTLTPESNDAELTAYLWPIVREIIRTAIENGQNLIVEGCYIPCGWRDSFDRRYLPEIRSIFLVMTERYIRSHFDSIKRYADIIENRENDDCTPERLIAENKKVLEQCGLSGQKVVLIDEEYRVEAKQLPEPGRGRMMKEEFLKIAAQLNSRFHISPLLFGSLGLEQRLHMDLNADDIDILIPETFLKEKWDVLISVMNEMGYVLRDLHEHEFKKADVSAAFASIENLAPFAGIDLEGIPAAEENGVHYRLLELQDYLKVYSASSKDGYRKNTKNKNDSQKIILIKKALGK